METIADAVLAEGLAPRAEIDDIVQGLYAFAEDRRTVMNLPRVVQAWGRRQETQGMLSQAKRFC